MSVNKVLPRDNIRAEVGSWRLLTIQVTQAGQVGAGGRGGVSISLHLTIMYLPVTSVARPKPRLTVSSHLPFFSHGTRTVVTRNTIIKKRNLLCDRVL